MCDRLTRHAQIDASEIDVDVKDGIVTLAGMVEGRRMKRLAERNVEMVLGVLELRKSARTVLPG